ARGRPLDERCVPVAGGGKVRVEAAGATENELQFPGVARGDRALVERLPKEDLLPAHTAHGEHIVGHLPTQRIRKTDGGQTPPRAEPPSCGPKFVRGLLAVIT